MLAFGDGQQRRIAIGTSARVQVENDDLGRLLRKGREDVDQGAVGPHRAVAAIEQSIRKVILTGFDDRSEAGIAAGPPLGLLIGLHGRVVCRSFQHGTDERAVQRAIALVFWRRFLPVDEVAVEVDIVFIHSARPRGAPGVDEVDGEDGGIVGKLPGRVLGEPGGLAGRTERTFDPMGAGNQHHELAGILASEIGDIGRKPLAIRAMQRVQIFDEARPGGACRGEEPGAQSGIVAGKQTGWRQ